MTRHKARKGFNFSSSNSEAVGHKTRMGFNLIEAAIVLGVVGFVLGGIWWAASAVREEYRGTKTIEATLKVISDVRTINAPFTPNQLSTIAVNIVDSSFLKPMYDAGVIPLDVFDNCNWTTNICKGLWGTNGIQLSVVKRPTGVGEYRLQVWTSKSACAKMGLALSRDWQKNRLLSINHQFMAYILMGVNTMNMDNLTYYCSILSNSYWLIVFEP